MPSIKLGLIAIRMITRANERFGPPRRSLGEVPGGRGVGPFLLGVMTMELFDPNVVATMVTMIAALWLAGVPPQPIE